MNTLLKSWNSPSDFLDGVLVVGTFVSRTDEQFKNDVVYIDFPYLSLSDGTWMGRRMRPADDR